MVVVAVKNTYIVAPADPTPVGRLSLSEFDQPRHWTLTPLLYVYKPNKSISTSSLIDTITTSLSRALVPFYPLAGRLRWIGGGRMELLCNADGAELVVAESTSRLDELTDFEPSAQIENLLPKFDYTSPIHTMPVASVTITKFACGGFTLGIAISHAVVDGGSFTKFVSAWAKLARGESLESHETPSHDRFIIGDAHAPPRFDHVEYKPLPLLIGRSDSREEEAKETTISMLKLTKSQVDQLKKRANSKTENRPYSTYETVTAHIWRCACKARNGQIGQRTVIRVIVDCRRRLKPPLPENYCGNAILFTITDPTCLMSDLVDNPLSYAAGKIREAIGSFTYEYIISALNLIASREDVSRLIREPEGSSNGRQFLGNPNLLVTSWINVPIYDGDFGWGRPVCVRPGPGAMDTDGKAFIIPSSNGDGSLVVVLRLQKQHMAGFKRWFYQDIECSISTSLASIQLLPRPLAPIGLVPYIIKNEIRDCCCYSENCSARVTKEETAATTFFLVTTTATTMEVARGSPAMDVNRSGDRLFHQIGGDSELLPVTASSRSDMDFFFFFSILVSGSRVFGLDFCFFVQIIIFGSSI